MCTSRSWGFGSIKASTRIFLASLEGRVMTFYWLFFSCSCFSLVPYLRLIHEWTRLMYSVTSFLVTAENSRLLRPYTCFSSLDLLSYSCPTTGICSYSSEEMKKFRFSIASVGVKFGSTNPSLQINWIMSHLLWCWKYQLFSITTLLNPSTVPFLGFGNWWVMCCPCLAFAFLIVLSCESSNSPAQPNWIFQPL